MVNVGLFGAAGCFTVCGEEVPESFAPGCSTDWGGEIPESLAPGAHPQRTQRNTITQITFSLASNILNLLLYARKINHGKWLSMFLTNKHDGIFRISLRLFYFIRGLSRQVSAGSKTETSG
jgi:hypothetical protein